MLLFRISVQLSVEPFLAHTVKLSAGLSNYQCTWAITSVANLIVSIGQFTLSVRYAMKGG